MAMNKRWLASLKKGQLHCSICSLLIYNRTHLNGDHDPIPRKYGGTQKKPAHYWCNQAKAHYAQTYSSHLERLMRKWDRHGVPYPPQARDSLMVLKLREEAIILANEQRKRKSRAED